MDLDDEEMNKRLERAFEDGVKYREITLEIAFEDGINFMKDKIKAKIEEWDNKGLTICYSGRSQGRTFQQAVRTEVKNILQSLLEEKE